jgi:hypothetical protein
MPPYKRWSSARALRRRSAAAPCAQPHLHQAGTPGERGHSRPVYRDAGLVAPRAAVLAAVLAIDADIRQMVRASDACRRLMSIPGVGQLTALAFTAAVDDPGRFRRSRDIGSYLGLVPRRYQSGEVDYQLGQYRGIDGVVAERLLVLLQSETVEPCPNVHALSPPRSLPRGLIVPRIVGMREYSARLWATSKRRSACRRTPPLAASTAASMC